MDRVPKDCAGEAPKDMGKHINMYALQLSGRNKQVLVVEHVHSVEFTAACDLLNFNFKIFSATQNLR